MLQILIGTKNSHKVTVQQSVANKHSKANLHLSRKLMIKL